MEDLILRPTAGVHARIPITELNSLNLSVGAGYAKYLDNGRFDYLVIRPDSDLSFDFFVRDFRINLHERVEYTEDPLSEGVVVGRANFGGLRNTVGASVDWNLHDLTISAGYDHFNFVSGIDEFDYLDRSEEQFSAGLTSLLSPTFTLGVEATLGIGDFDEELLNDYVSVSVGPVLRWRWTPQFSLGARGGYVRHDFDGGGLEQESEGLDSYYAIADISHIVNPRISHRLQVRKQMLTGVFSDATDLTEVRYGIVLRVVRNVSLTAQAVYETASLPRNFIEEQSYDRYGGTVSLSYRLFRKVDAGVTYRYFERSASDPRRDYYQNSLLFILRYHP
jgi:hypothetical protein